ncbi:hypothetical protein [Helicobacter suis]|uniref:hypothetical protein n=1 Tax=Helicobacter suis TaxID=104628 RepID=UPI0013D5E4C3|nr:hypothetical protein [Helicobacter suis]
MWALLVSAFMFSGCMRVYKPVYIPTACKIPKRMRPALNAPTLAGDIAELLIYTELLEEDLNFCTKESNGTKR